MPERPRNGFEAFLERVISEAKKRKPDPVQRTRAIAIVISLVTSVLFWFTLNMRKNYTYEIELPTQVERIPNGWALATPVPATIHAEVEGVGWQLLQLSQRPPSIPLDAAQARTERRVDLQQLVGPRQFPKGVTVKRIQPQFATLKLERELTRQVPIQYRGRIGTASSFEVLRPPQFTPSHVTVRGPESVIKALKYWPTTSLNLNGLRTPYEREEFPLADTLQGLVQIDHQETSVKIEVAQFTEAQRQVKVIVQGLPPEVNQVRFVPAEVTVKYTIPLQQYNESLSSDDFVAVVTYAQILADHASGTVIPTLKPPPVLAVRQIRFSPRRLQYFIVREMVN